MKIAFHFDADDKRLGNYYGAPVRRALFGAILNSRTIDLHTKIFQGDILLGMLTMDRESTEEGEVHRFNEARFISSVQTLLDPGSHVWMTFSDRTVERLLNGNVFVLLFESMSFRDAREIDASLQNYPWYLGALQIDDACRVHWVAYANSMIASYRIIGRDLHLFWDGYSDDKDEGHAKELQKLGFASVNFEALNGKFTVFDKHHDYQEARRVAELGSALSDALGTMADQVISRFSDAAPELGNKLWSAIRTYDRAEVAEDYAQVAVSCRRVIEYVADSIFPPVEDSTGGRRLGSKNYRNRLLAFADRERASDANVDLICASTALLSEQLEKLGNLLNKGVHAEVSRHEARRCLLRTIMALDDILSLKRGALRAAQVRE